MEMKLVCKIGPDCEEPNAHAGKFGLWAIRTGTNFENLKRKVITRSQWGSANLVSYRLDSFPP